VIKPNEAKLPLCLQQLLSGSQIRQSPAPRAAAGGWYRAKEHTLRLDAAYMRDSNCLLCHGRPATSAPARTPEEIFHFLFFYYCLRAKKGYSMGDRAPTTGGVHNV
jgi:hypothetical protein